MVGEIKFTLAQINPTVGDIAANVAKILCYCQFAKEKCAADVVIFPELAISGYPPEDLLLRDDFLRECERGLAELKARALGIVVIIGHPLRENGKIFNALSVLCDGKTRAIYRKRHLPNDGVFDEKRYFTAGKQAQVIDIFGIRIGLTICEDIWQTRPLKQCVELDADLVISINASPFHNEIALLREEGVVLKKARQFGLPMIYLNQVGGQDELVFDGCSVAVNGCGEVAARLPAFCEASRTIIFKQNKFLPSKIDPHFVDPELTYRALVLGARDYVKKNHFNGIVLGLSGGIDSALSCAIAVDAIGKELVMAVMMPSRYTSDISCKDARAEAQALGVRYEVIPIETLYQTTTAQLKPLFEGMDLPANPVPDIAEQNIQARCRAMVVMAISNKLGYLLLTTGNKSEMAVGYATLYGDMAGGFSVLKDVPKMSVYQLAKYRNGIGKVIPERVIARAPSAELAPAQKDVDSLPPYEVLDPILEAFIEHDRSAEQIIAAGFDAATVHRVLKLVVANEHKRRQAATGVRVTPRAFGKDWRYPITSGFHRSSSL